MRSLWQMVRDNPVLSKEMRVRMRGTRAYWILAAYLGILAAMLFFQYAGWYYDAIRYGQGVAGSARIGQQFFTSIWLVQAFLVAFITPAITAGAITMEKEQQTLDMLHMTHLRPGAIVAGKLLSAVGFIGLLLISSIPLSCLCFFLGGVSPEEIVNVYLLLFAGSFFTGSLGLAWSSIARSTTTSVIFTYATLIGLVVAAGVVSAVGSRGFDDQIASGLALAVFGIPRSGSSSYVSFFFNAWDSRHFYGLTVPAWLPSALTYGLLGLLLCAGTAARLRPNDAPNRRIVGILLGLAVAEQLFFAFGGWFFPFTRSAPPGVGSYLASYSPMMLLFQPIALLLACVPVLSTFGPSARADRPAMRGFVTLFSLLMLTFVMYGLSFFFIGQPEGIFTGRLRSPEALGIVSAQGPGSAGPGSVFTVAVAMSASLAGLWALGWLLSVTTRNRWAALVLSGAALLVVLIAPMVARDGYQTNQTGGASLLLNLLYLDPFGSLLQATNDSDTYTRLPLLFGSTPLWLVTTLAYSGFSGAVGLAAWRRGARRSVRADLAVSC